MAIYLRVVRLFLPNHPHTDLHLGCLDGNYFRESSAYEYFGSDGIYGDR